MKAQTVFDKVADHLLTQGEQAYEHGNCVYRSNDGKTCAVGCLMSDKVYRKHMEDGYSVSGLILDFKLPKYFKDNQSLLYALQLVHDADCPTESQLTFWRQQLEGVATRFGLNPSPKMKELGVTC